MPQNIRISTFTRIVSPIDSTSDHTKQPGMKRNSVRLPGRLDMKTIWSAFLEDYRPLRSSSRRSQYGSRLPDFASPRLIM